jgi:hypothetical protein
MVPGKLTTKQKLGKGIPDGTALKGGELSLTPENVQ